MAPLNITSITSIKFDFYSTNPGNYVFKVDPDLLDRRGPIKNYILNTTVGLLVDAGALQLAGVSTQWEPIAGHVGRARLYAVKGDIKNILEQVANDTYYGNTKNARSQRELDVRITRQFIATQILAML